MTIAGLNGLSREDAERELARCCGSSRWAAAVAARRPFRDAAQLYRDAEEVWWSLEGGDWLEAFSRHPRIGERAAGWSADEQSGVLGASSSTVRDLAERNHEYERRFGHVFLISAAGRKADEMLAAIEQRMTNDPATELRVAAAEQAKITRLRLERLVNSPVESSRAR